MKAPRPQVLVGLLILGVFIWIKIVEGNEMASCNGELTTIECASWNYVYAECSINETRTIISATVSTKHSSSACDFYDGTLPEDYDGPGKYGFTNNVLWVHKGCRAEFEICSVVSGECGEGHDLCLPWEACNIHLDYPTCVKINDCSDHDGQGCDAGQVCCGGGSGSCVCPSPKVKDKHGQCRDCDCPWNELCTAPHGDCVCGEHQVREHHGGHGGPCVDCDPDLSCPECGPEKICHINQGNKSSSCECLPGSVEKDGECVLCHGCPRDCGPDHVCITPGFGEPYCGCPPGTDEIDGKCVPCPRCQDCTDGKVCVVEGSNTHCECPSGTKPHGHGCIALPHPVFHRRGGPRFEKDGPHRYGYGHGHDHYDSSHHESEEYGSGHHGSIKYGSGHHGSDEYGSGHHGSGYHGNGRYEDRYHGIGDYKGVPHVHHGHDHHGDGHYDSSNYGKADYGSGQYEGGPHESGDYEGGPYGNGPHGIGHYGKGPHGNSYYGKGPHGRGPHGRDPHGSGLYGSDYHGSSKYRVHPHGKGFHHGSGSHGKGHSHGSVRTGGHDHASGDKGLLMDFIK